MKRALFITLFLVLMYSNIECEVTVLENFLIPFRSIKNRIYKYNAPSVHKKENFDQLIRLNKLQPRIQDSVPFPCDLKDTRSPQPPTSVHKLRPGDIDVIGAIGDSITAGNGLLATNVAQVALECRGLSFSIGGQGTWREFFTLPNFLKVFNPKLFGFSYNTSSTLQKESQFNVAELGAISADTPFMAQALVNRILNDKRVDVQKHWKLITIMIGPNDVCTEICYQNKLDLILTKHKSDLLQVLRTLRDNLPRTIINLIPGLNPLLMRNTNSPSVECRSTRSLECSCVFGLAFQSRANSFNTIYEKWQQLDIEIGNYAEFQRDDFTIAVQPLSINMTLPLNSNGNLDFSYLAPDCFHFSQKGNAILARSLWNNMLDPVGRKSPISYNSPTFFKCPSEENPYIFTNSNSK